MRERNYQFKVVHITWQPSESALKHKHAVRLRALFARLKKPEFGPGTLLQLSWERDANDR